MASCSFSFVEGGVEDSCSICLDGFCYTNPVTVTTCKHGYHLQCILEWAQRSKDCPMCWQPIGFEDPNSQELLHAVEQERCIRRRRQSPPRFQQTPLVDLEFDHVPGNSDLEDSIMQQLASVAMGRAHLMPRRRDRIPTSHEHLQYVIVPSPIPSMGDNPSSPHLAESSSDQITSVYIPMGEMGGPVSFSFRDGVEPMEHASQHGAGPSDLQSFSGTLKSRITAVSSRYKESFAKTTRGFRERLWGRNNNMPDCGARAREMSAGVVRALEQISLESPSSASSDRSDYESNGESSRRSSHRVVPQPLHGQTCN